MTGKSRLVVGLAILTLLGLIVAGLAGLGAVRADRPSMIGRRPPAFQAFTMIREETTMDGVTRTYEFVYEDDFTWKHTLLTHDSDPRSLIGPGYTVEHRDGKMIWTVAGETHSDAAPTDGFHKPGRWLENPSTLMGWASARGSPVSIAQRSATDDLTHHFTMNDGGYQHTFQFHAETGIPMHYEQHLRDKLLVRHTVVSLVLANGEKLR